MANLESISHRCYLFEVAFVWELTKETIVLPLGCLQGGEPFESAQPTILTCAPILHGFTRVFACECFITGLPRS